MGVYPVADMSVFRMTDVMSDVGTALVPDMVVGPVADMSVFRMTNVMSDVGAALVADMVVGSVPDMTDAGAGRNSHKGGRCQYGCNSDCSFQHC